MAYTKLFNSILTSTIWTEDDRTRIVWITLLALADKNGEVQASVPGLARVAGVPVEDCRSAIIKFLSPDPDSRTKDDEGRRIEEIDGGWSLLNHAKYRDLASKEDSIRKNAERQARYRDSAKRNGKVTACNGKVTQGRDIADSETDSETDSDADANAEVEEERKSPTSHRSKADEIESLPMAKSYVTKKGFQKILKDHPDLDPISEKKPDLYEILVRDKFHVRNEKSGAMEPIRHLQNFLLGFAQKLEEDSKR